MFLGLVVRVGIVFATEVLAARLLLPEQYGLITWALFALNLLSMFTGMGLNTAVRRYLPMYTLQKAFAEIRGLVTLAAITSTVLGLGVGLAIYLSPTATISDFLGSPEAGNLVKVLIVALPAWNLMKTMLAIFSGYKRPLYKVIIEDIGVPLGCMVAVLLAWFCGWGVMEIAIGYSAVYGLGALAATMLVTCKTPFTQTKNIAPRFETKKVLGFAWPLIFTEPLGKLTGLIDVLIIGWLANAYLVGIYRIASDMAAIMSLFLMCLSFLYMPIATEYFASHRMDEWRDLNARVARWAMTCCFPIFAILFFFPKEVILLIYGPAYLEAEDVLRILAVAYYGHVMVGFTGLNLAIAGRTKIQLFAHILGTLMNILGTIFLLPILGIEGAALSSLAGLFLVNIVAMWFNWQYLYLQPFNLFYLRIFFLLISIASMLSYIIKNNIEVKLQFSLTLFSLGMFFQALWLFRKKWLFDSIDIQYLNALLKKVAH